MKNPDQCEIIVDDINYFKRMFDKVINMGLPQSRNGNEDIIPKEEYRAKLKQKRNEVPQTDALEGVITGGHVIGRPNPYFQIWLNLKKCQ